MADLDSWVSFSGTEMWSMHDSVSPARTRLEQAEVLIVPMLGKSTGLARRSLSSYRPHTAWASACEMVAIDERRWVCFPVTHELHPLL